MDFQVLCKTCGKPHDSSYGSGKFCSARCAHIRPYKGEHSKAVELLCDHCKLPFVRPFKKRKAKFCSRSCSTRAFLDKNPEHQREAGKKSAYVQRTLRRSRNEILFAEMCKSTYENVSTNEPLFNGWDADVILHDQHVAVLWNGAWHYKDIMKGVSLKQIQNRDDIKLSEIVKAGFQAYVIADMGRHDPTFVSREFSKFKNFIAGVENRHLMSLINSRQDVQFVSPQPIDQ